MPKLGHRPSTAAVRYSRVVCTLARPWHDGTRHLIFTPHEFLERLAAITPRPRINLVIYHGLLAPRARWRPPESSDPLGAAPSGLPSTGSGPAALSAPPPSAPTPVSPAPASEPATPSSAGRPRPSSPPPTAPKRSHRAWAWADLMRRVFAMDVLACAGCGGRLRFIATIGDPATVTKILAHLGLPTDAPALIPARSPPQPDGFDFS